MSDLPIFYSFRRCPYAMRARTALASSGKTVVLREVVLRDKPAAMLAVSPKATVPVLILDDGTVIDESLDIIEWALGKNDPEGLTAYEPDTLNQMNTLIEENDGPFKSSLDRYKYPNRYDAVDPVTERSKGAAFLHRLDQMLEGQAGLFGDRLSKADIAILPFVRQFAHVDRDWFSEQPWDNVKRWLSEFLESDRFKKVMVKHPQWHEGDPPIYFE